MILVYACNDLIVSYSLCPEEGRVAKAAAIIMHEELCKALGDCASCVSTSYYCEWCQGQGTCRYKGERCKSTHSANSNDIDMGSNLEVNFEMIVGITPCLSSV